MCDDNIDWTKYVGFSTDFGRSMSGCYGGMQALDALWTQCIFHTEGLSKMGSDQSTFLCSFSSRGFSRALILLSYLQKVQNNSNLITLFLVSFFDIFMQFTKFDCKILLSTNKCTLILFMYFYFIIFTNTFRPVVRQSSGLICQIL